ncbi:membrane protein [Escherichia coli]|nr:membrane protein [Escherichia coli]
MIKFRLYIPPVILGFVIVPLLVWPTVIVLGKVRTSS